jgi:hypothetical protein
MIRQIFMPREAMFRARKAATFPLPMMMTDDSFMIIYLKLQEYNLQ